MRTLKIVCLSLFLATLWSCRECHSSETPTPVPTPAADPTLQGVYLMSGNWTELKRGWNVLSLHVTDAENVDVNDAEVTVLYDMVGMPMDPPNLPVEFKGDGVYGKKIFLGMRGSYKYDITINKDNKVDTLTLNKPVN